MLASDVDRYRVVDSDTHVIEPYDLWTSRISVKKWGDLVPHVKWDDELLEDAWYFGSARVARGASAASAGWPHYPPDHPPRLELADPATWDPQARLRRMDEDGIWAQVLYPNVAGFGAGRLLTLRDPEIMLACVQAYNDFLAEYASVDARRFVPIMALPMWDISLCQAEVARSADRGHKGVIMTGEPVQWGLPHLADPHWDPLWATLQEAELSVNFHIAAGDISKKYDVVYEHAGEELVALSHRVGGRSSGRKISVTRIWPEAQGVSPATVQRVWSARRLQPHRVETFKLSMTVASRPSGSTWPAGSCYLRPPDKAAVLCIDEKKLSHRAVV
jgi:predicted TIM-barrel fold metal-dependent hydrolase